MICIATIDSVCELQTFYTYQTHCKTIYCVWSVDDICIQHTISAFYIYKKHIPSIKGRQFVQFSIIQIMKQMIQKRMMKYHLVENELTYNKIRKKEGKEGGIDR